HRGMSGSPTPPPGVPPGGPASQAAARAKLRAERLAIGGAAGLAGLKLGTGLAIGSIGLVSAAADSLLDVAISSLNLLSLRIAAALHYATDVWTNGGVLLALVLVVLTGSAVFDALIAILVGGFIGVSAYRLLARSVQDLMDAALPEAEQREIERIVRGHRFV